MIIVFSSKSRSSEKYARSLASRTGLECFSVDDAYPEEAVIFFGWMRHNTVVGLRKVDPRMLKAVCAVGLDSESHFDRAKVADANGVVSPVYYMRGWIDRSRLDPLDKAVLLCVCVAMKLRGLDDSGVRIYEAMMNGGSFYDESYLDSIELFIRSSSHRRRAEGR